MLTNTKNYPCYLCNKHHTSKSWDRALLATWNECSLPFKSKLETERKMLSDAELLNSPREVTEHFSKMGSDLKSIQALWHSLSKAPYAHSQDKRLISLKEEQHREPDSLGEERKCLQTQLSINRFLPPPHQLRFVCQCKKKKGKNFQVQTGFALTRHIHTQLYTANACEQPGRGLWSVQFTAHKAKSGSDFDVLCPFNWWYTSPHPHVPW